MDGLMDGGRVELTLVVACRSVLRLLCWQAGEAVLLLARLTNYLTM